MAKRAVLIGINAYQDVAVADLRGCLNDVELLTDVLTSHHGFAAEDITTVVDPDNTRQQILDALDRLVDVTEQGDAALIYYSGHGSQALDANAEEEDDDYDETIVPSDSGRGDLPVRDIVDDELNSFVTALAQKTDQATFIFDSCHSGSVDRGLLEPADRDELPAPRAIVAADTPPEPEPHIRLEAADQSGGERSESGMLRQGGYLLIAGCLDHQTSKETDFEGRRHGALTYFLVEALSGGEKMTLQAAFDHAVQGVGGAVKDQDPVLEGPQERKDARPF